MNAAANYREMLRRELAPFRPRSDEDVIRVLTESWGHADASPPGWSEAERDVRLLWAALGLLAFGQLDHVERALSIIRDRPDVVRRRECMYYVSALRNVLPVPRELSPVNEPARVLDWLRGHSAELRWDDEAGAFVVQPVADDPAVDRAPLADDPAVDRALLDDGTTAWAEELWLLLEGTLDDGVREDEYAIAG